QLNRLFFYNFVAGLLLFPVRVVRAVWQGAQSCWKTAPTLPSQPSMKGRSSRTTPRFTVTPNR
ncbi:hypothetical protein PENTCL1PPCAC_26077, partial [Pristionchus entomophagus]